MHWRISSVTFTPKTFFVGRFADDLVMFLVPKYSRVTADNRSNVKISKKVLTTRCSFPSETSKLLPKLRTLSCEEKLEELSTRAPNAQALKPPTLKPKATGSASFGTQHGHGVAEFLLHRKVSLRSCLRHNVSGLGSKGHGFGFWAEGVMREAKSQP